MKKSYCLCLVPDKRQSLSLPSQRALESFVQSEGSASRSILPHLRDAVIREDNITIVMAKGTHNLMTKEELEAWIGKNAASRYPVVPHDARQHGSVPVAIPHDKSIVKISPAVAHAVFSISVSSILPHTMEVVPEVCIAIPPSGGLVAPIAGWEK